MRASAAVSTTPNAKSLSASEVYAPGRLRDETDAARDAVSTFVRDFPEYAGLPFDVIQQHMDYRTRTRAASLGLRVAEGIPEQWQPVGDGDLDVQALRCWSDDQ